MDTLAHTHGCVQAWPYVACSYSVWRGISMPQVLGCRVLACVGYRPLDGLLAGVTHMLGDHITLWLPSWTLEGFTTELQYILYHTITVGIGDYDLRLVLFFYASHMATRNRSARAAQRAPDDAPANANAPKQYQLCPLPKRQRLAEHSVRPSRRWQAHRRVHAVRPELNGCA